MADTDTYIDSINSRGAALDCPSCGRFDWGPASEFMLVPALAEEEPVDLTRGYPVFALICDHCGFMRMHLTSVLERPESPPNDPIETSSD